MSDRDRTPKVDQGSPEALLTGLLLTGRPEAEATHNLGRDFLVPLRIAAVNYFKGMGRKRTPRLIAAFTKLAAAFKCGGIPPSCDDDTARFFAVRDVLDRADAVKRSLVKSCLRSAVNAATPPTRRRRLALCLTALALNDLHRIAAESRNYCLPPGAENWPGALLEATVEEATSRLPIGADPASGPLAVAVEKLAAATWRDPIWLRTVATLKRLVRWFEHEDLRQLVHVGLPRSLPDLALLIEIERLVEPLKALENEIDGIVQRRPRLLEGALEELLQELHAASPRPGCPDGRVRRVGNRRRVLEFLLEARGRQHTRLRATAALTLFLCLRDALRLLRGHGRPRRGTDRLVVALRHATVEDMPEDVQRFVEFGLGRIVWQPNAGLAEALEFERRAVEHFAAVRRLLGARKPVLIVTDTFHRRASGGTLRTEGGRREVVLLRPDGTVRTERIDESAALAAIHEKFGRPQGVTPSAHYNGKAKLNAQLLVSERLLLEGVDVVDERAPS